MKIKTRFDLGDTCYLMVPFSNKPIDLTVNGVYTEVSEVDGKIETRTEYTIGQTDSIQKYREDRLFASKDECDVKVKF